MCRNVIFVQDMYNSSRYICFAMKPLLNDAGYSLLGTVIAKIDYNIIHI